MMNKDRLMAVRTKILEHHENFDYRMSIAARDSENPKTYAELLKNCGTVGCVVGFTLAVAGVPYTGIDEFDRARHYLALTENQASFLFFCKAGYGMPTESYSSKTYVEAIKRIDALLASE